MNSWGRAAALVVALLTSGSALHAQQPPGNDTPAAGRKVLRVAFSTAETGFDPAQISDIYSRTVTPHIFEGLYRYDHLARPVRVRPLTAAGMPEVSADYRTWTIRITPGIRFADDPAFGGRPRELVAEDYVYSIKRFADPANKSPMWGYLESYGILGLARQRQRALDGRQAFDYDAPIEGLRALDRYTLQIRLAEPRPRLHEMLAQSDLFGAVARETVQHYGEAISAHPVGTGPFRLKQWRRSSLIVLERNPYYREVRYDEQPAEGDADGQALRQRLQGRRLPMVDEVHISIIEENQPRWLSFLNGQIDALAGQYGSVPLEFVNLALPNGKLAPHLERRGMRGYQQVNADSALTYFNMEDPVLGGYTPERVALRRAIGLALDVDREIRVVRRGQAVPAQSPIVPHTSGYSAAFKSENGDQDPARARALLDLYGYVDKDGDGWRDQPDGKPLVLEIATQSDQLSRQFDELWKNSMEAVGLRVRFTVGQWPEQLKQARAGKLMLWVLGSSAAAPDGQGALQRLHGPQSGGQNLARFRLPAFDAVYDRLSALPDGPEREALFHEAKRLTVAYMPYKTHVHRISTDLLHPWVHGFRRPVFWNEWWHLVDVDPQLRAQVVGRER